VLILCAATSFNGFGHSPVTAARIRWRSRHRDRQDGRLVEGRIHSKLGNPCRVESWEAIQVLTNEVEVATKQIRSGLIEFAAQPGEEYVLTSSHGKSR
jgi:hypothetical protein